MEIRPFHKDDAPALAELSAYYGRGETDFVLNPYWQTEEELFAEFDRFGISPEEHLLVADAGDGEVLGLVGFLRQPGASQAGLCCPIVTRHARGKGIGGELLRAVKRLGREQLGIRLATAGIGTRNRAGYSLLTSLGFRPLRQHFLMRCDARPEASHPAIEGVELGPATEADADAILAIYAACGFEQRSPELMRRVLGDGRHAHAVARQGSRVIAFCELETHWPQRVWVSYVGVEPELRDRGLGTALVSWSLARQFDGGAETALLMLSPANRTAFRAYEKGGFRRFRLVDVLEITL
ncbi:MAG: GNAT family N-acetyltransferase [Myxococcota bacterium]